MKFFITKYLLIFALAITLFGSCGKAEMASPEVEKIKKSALDSGAEPIIVSSAMFNSVTLPFTVTGYTIEEEIIWMPVQHPGFSSFSDFALVTDGNVQNINGNYVINVKLIRSNGTASKKISSKELSFSLAPLHAYIPNSVILNIAGVGQIPYNH